MQKEEVLNLLKEIKYLNFDEDIVSFGFVKDIEIGDQIVVNLDLPNISEENVEILYAKVHAKFKENGIENLKLNITRKESPKAEAKEARNLLSSVKNVIMISSGKGGVGKSTTTVNLAIALAMQGKKVGIIDADIYGPNIPRMLKFDKEKEQIMMNEDDKIIPYENYGVKMISMGHFLADGESAIWRGPVVIRAVQQLMEDVAWGELDYMVIDLPPGTGDTQLTVAQSTKVSLGIVVTTPQNVSLDDSARSLDMFTKMDIKIGGIIENMSGFLCPNCNTVHDIFGKDTTEALANKYNTKVLGQIPIDMSVRESGDIGKPVTFFNPSSKVSESYMKVAYEVIESLEK